MPDGIRWNLNSSPSRTIVWPALFPPWNRTTISARSASRSVTLPLPSSPHWAPTTIRTLIDSESRSRGRRGRSGEGGPARVECLAQVVPVHGDLVGHLGQARDDADTDLGFELVEVEVRGDED